MKRGRKPKAFKRASISGGSILSVDAHRLMERGEVSNSVWWAYQVLRASGEPPDPSGAFVLEEFLKEKEGTILVGLLTKAYRTRDGSSLRELADLVEGRGKGDDLALALVRCVSLRMTMGERWHAAAERIPGPVILEDLKAQSGIKADWTTVRRALNAFGVKRRRGRPSGKTRNS